MFKDKIKIKVTYYMPSCCDIDNFIKLLLDGLQHNQVIENDKNVVKLSLTKINTLRKEQHLIITIKNIN
tara:strand:+ start:390 stop:596 length:207 start_codon:yes stop_codon:yes gene_type:complete